MNIADKYFKEDIEKILNEGVWNKNPRQKEYNEYSSYTQKYL